MMMCVSVKSRNIGDQRFMCQCVQKNLNVGDALWHVSHVQQENEYYTNIPVYIAAVHTQINIKSSWRGQHCDIYTLQNTCWHPSLSEGWFVTFSWNNY